ncbi:hypothetical protein SARC_14921, partial [Sphaeroforma arctica JP610]
MSDPHGAETANSLDVPPTQFGTSSQIQTVPENVSMVHLAQGKGSSTDSMYVEKIRGRHIFLSQEQLFSGLLVVCIEHHKYDEALALLREDPEAHMCTEELAGLSLWRPASRPIINQLCEYVSKNELAVQNAAMRLYVGRMNEHWSDAVHEVNMLVLLLEK